MGLLSYWGFPREGGFSTEGTENVVFRDLLKAVGDMAQFTLISSKPDGHAVQMGDNDSGRFFKLLPVKKTPWTTDICWRPSTAYLREATLRKLPRVLRLERR